MSLFSEQHWFVARDCYIGAGGAVVVIRRVVFWPLLCRSFWEGTQSRYERILVLGSTVHLKCPIKLPNMTHARIFLTSKVLCSDNLKSPRVYCVEYGQGRELAF